jgi:hypothetical protein
MNIHRWYWSVTLASVFLLIAVSSAYGQSVTLTISPPNPVAGQPITFTGETPGPAGITLYIYLDTLPPTSGTCDAVFDSSLTPVATFHTSGATGQFTVTLPTGLSAGTYDAVTDAAVFSGTQAGIFTACNTFKVSSA